MKINTSVKLKTFIGTVKAYKKVEKKENYWKLIGEKGKIISEKKNKLITNKKIK